LKVTTVIVVKSSTKQSFHRVEYEIAPSVSWSNTTYKTWEKPCQIVRCVFRTSTQKLLGKPLISFEPKGDKGKTLNSHRYRQLSSDGWMWNGSNCYL